MGFEHSLPLWHGGQIYVEVDTNTVIAGAIVKGTVHINQSQVFYTS